MTRSLRNLLIAGGCLAAGAAAIKMGRPLNERQVTDVLAADARMSLPSPWRTHTDTVQSGEQLVAVLGRAGVGSSDASAALNSARVLDPRRVRAGTEITTRIHNDSGPAEISFQVGIDRVVKLRREADQWVEEEVLLPWTVDTVGVSGVVNSTLTEAIAEGADAFPAGIRTELAYALADILEYRVDLSRDLRKGDSVFVLLERKRAPNGLVRPGEILAARMFVGGRTLETVRFSNSEHKVAYYDGDGRSMRAAFLRAPLAFRRISSVFGTRRHPILNTVKKHTGTDYAAPTGTPVRALGDGTVIFVGVRGGYGKTIEIRHPNGFVTRYAHLNGYATGIKRGTSVSISRTIGYVGSTGLATGPHLHLEVLVGGVHRDPRVALRDVAGEPLGTRDKAAFVAQRAELFQQLDAAVNSRTFLAVLPAGD